MQGLREGSGSGSGSGSVVATTWHRVTEYGKTSNSLLLICAMLGPWPIAPVPAYLRGSFLPSHSAFRSSGSIGVTKRSLGEAHVRDIPTWTTNAVFWLTTGGSKMYIMSMHDHLCGLPATAILCSLYHFYLFYPLFQDTPCHL